MLFNSAPGRIRTCDPRIRSGKMCVLSYPSMSEKAAYLHGFPRLPCSRFSIPSDSVLAQLHTVAVSREIMLTTFSRGSRIVEAILK
jgi:hypothetical protein